MLVQCIRVFRVFFGAVFRRTWFTLATERKTARSTKSAETAVSTAVCKNAWRSACPKKVRQVRAEVSKLFGMRGFKRCQAVWWVWRWKGVRVVLE